MNYEDTLPKPLKPISGNKSPEVDLWSKVLREAVRMAIRHGDDSGSNHERDGLNSIKYFKSRDCKTICDLLGLDQVAVYEAVLRQREKYLDLCRNGHTTSKALKIVMGVEGADE